MKTYKKLDNFLYYYKYHLIFVVFIIITLTMFITDYIKKPKYDYTVAIITEDSISDSSLDFLNSYLCKNGKDLNSDRNIKINLANYVLSDNPKPQEQTAGITKFIADWNTCDSMILIYSDKIYTDYKDKDIFDVNSNSIIKLKDCLPKPNSELDYLNISLRTLDSSNSKFNEKKQKYYLESKELFENIIR